MKPIKIKCLNYKNSRFTLSVVFCAIIALALNFILSAQVSINAQDNLHTQPNTSAASCPQIDPKIPQQQQQENPEKEFDFEEAVFVDPPNSNRVTQVDIGLYVIDISNVNAVENTYRLEGLIDLVWCDPRLKTNSKEKQERIYLEEDADVKIKRRWWTSVTFVNAV